MSELIQKTDYSTNLDLMLEQYKNASNVRGMIDSSNDQADDLEAAIFEVRDLYYIDTAEGVQLDFIGDIWDVPRNGESDSDYRMRIKTTAALQSSGNPEEIINILKALFGATFVTYIPGYPSEPGSYTVITDAVITVSELKIFSSSGVGVSLGGFMLLESGDFLLLEDGVSKLII